MTQVQHPQPQPVEADTVILDGEFLKDQAREALESFFTPLLGVYAAATGKRPTLRRRIWRRIRHTRKAA